MIIVEKETNLIKKLSLWEFFISIGNNKKNYLLMEVSMVKIGEKAPSFNAQAFYNGSFTNVNLEDYKGKWVYLFFYGGDFTFV